MSHAKASPLIDTRVAYCGDNAHPPRKPRTKEQRRPHRRAFYLRHRQRLLREMKEYRDHKRDRTKAAEYQRNYYLNNKARLNAINRAYYHKHKIRLNKINSTRRRAGIIKTDMLRKREWTRERRKQSDYRARERLYRQRVNVKIKHNLSRRIRRALLNNQKSGKTVELLGCSIEQLKLFLASQFTPEMQWENYGSHWHIDHHIPCAAHDLSDPEEQKRCFHWHNLRPLKARENMRKNDKDPRTGTRVSHHIMESRRNRTLLSRDGA